MRSQRQGSARPATILCFPLWDWQGSFQLLLRNEHSQLFRGALKKRQVASSSGRQGNVGIVNLPEFETHFCIVYEMSIVARELEA